MTKKKILVTTPDYPPMLGGLSTFSKNLVNLLEESGYEVKVFCWSSLAKASKGFSLNKDYDFFFHVHYLGGFLGGFPASKSINFCHGSELFFTSPNFIKRIIKKLTIYKTFKYFRKSKQNVFISKFTQEILQNNGFKINYSRDLIFHNCIPLPEQAPLVKSLGSGEGIKLCSIARDVPHKNLSGVFKLAGELAKISKVPIELSMTSKRFKSTDQVIYKDISGLSDESIGEVYLSSHYNILLSKDDSAKGFIEGFGLTTLEAAKYCTPSLVSNSGGLKENIHHEFNGYRFEEISESSVEEFFKRSLTHYSSWSKNSYEHLVISHSMKVFQKLLDKIIGGACE
jgi:glycosyltransferase involved in cell wall biosynthesis